MKISMYGSGMEVGRSCVCIDDRYLFDSGLKISEEGSEYPVLFDAYKIKAVFLSHAHLDHCGALPLFNHRGLSCPIYCNPMTKATSRILLKDSLHVELLNSHVPGYAKENIYNVLDLMEKAPYGKRLEAAGAHFTFFEAGHIPGSACILLEYEGARILYTGDINTRDTRLLKGLSASLKADIMLCEATYGDREHPDRAEMEQQFLDRIEETLRNSGSVLVPVFAVGRAQEVLMILSQRKWSRPVYLDGMSKKVTSLYLSRPEYIRSEESLKKAVSRVKFIKSRGQRRDLVSEKGIFVTTSGMLDGGPVVDYLGAMYHDEKSSILLTGFQTPESNGRLLLDEGKVFIDGHRIKVRCRVEKFDFSAHAGRQELVKLIRTVNPRHLVLHHGDEPAIRALATDFADRNVHMPKTGETIEVRL